MAIHVSHSLHYSRQTTDLEALVAFTTPCRKPLGQVLTANVPINGHLPSPGPLFQTGEGQTLINNPSKVDLRAELVGSGCSHRLGHPGKEGAELIPAEVTPPFTMGIPNSSRTKPLLSVFCTKYSFFSSS